MDDALSPEPFMRDDELRAARDNDGDDGGDGFDGDNGGDGALSPVFLPERVEAAIQALRDESGCTVGCHEVNTPDGVEFLCDDLRCPPGRDLDDLLLDQLVDAARESGAKAVRFGRDTRKPNDAIGRLENRLQRREKAAIAAADVLNEADTRDLSDLSRQTCGDIAARLAKSKTGQDKQNLIGVLTVLSGQPGSFQQDLVAEEIERLTPYARAWITQMIKLLTDPSVNPNATDRILWRAFRDAVR
jgi:hypothetical protein